MKDLKKCIFTKKKMHILKIEKEKKTVPNSDLDLDQNIQDGRKALFRHGGCKLRRGGQRRR
jgi:hypothetical protein